VGDVQIGGNPQVEVEHVQVTTAPLSDEGGTFGSLWAKLCLFVCAVQRLTFMLSVEQRLKRQVEIEKTRSQQVPLCFCF
jgi:hypothetical protein